MNVLIIEDEPKVATFLNKGLSLHGFKTDVIHDGILGFKKITSEKDKYDVIILDVNLPGMNGYEICEKIRQEHITTPVLMLTALGSTSNKVRGFDLGAQDYLVKPFDFEELLARIKSLIKRSVINPVEENLIKVADLEMNIQSKTVTRGGKKIELTAKEFFLLEYLLRNKGKVLTRTNIAEKIWDINFDTGTNVIDLYIFYLRKKIDKDFSKKLIHTQVGMGYILKENEE
jgi:two-component system, OmpR family, copper resistance phosphate regulon response regulator CusR